MYQFSSEYKKSKPNKIYSFLVPSARQTSDQDQIPIRVPETADDSTRIKELIEREKQQVFLSVVRCIGRPKVVSAAIHSESQGLTEKKKRELMNASGPKKEFLYVKEREKEILERVQPEFGGKLREIVDEYRDVFPEELPKGRPPKRQTLRHNPQTGLHIV